MDWVKLKNQGEKVKTSSLSFVAQEVLFNRISGTKKDIYKFLNPKLSYLQHPHNIRDLNETTDIIVEKIRNKDNIIVHGDYDVDGITSTVILCKTIKELSGNVSWWLPHRKKDGYGISNRFIKHCIKNKPDLIITVDCGITEHKNIKKLKENGFDVIVVDHHTVDKDGVPKDALKVIDTHREDETSRFKDFAGVGVTFKVCWSICEKMSAELPVKVSSYLKSILPYVGLGTISDVMPLVDENRIIVSKSLELINEGKVDGGLNHLLTISNLELGKINSRDIGFMVAPRINSAGRMEDPSIAFDCLFNNDKEKSLVLDVLNSQRKELSESLFLEALKLKDEQCKDDDEILVIAGENWNSGIVGIIAGKIKEEFEKPTIVLNIIEEKGKKKVKGSARSIEGYNLYKTVESLSDSLLSFGGHAQALGVAIEFDKIDDFRKKINSKEIKKSIVKMDIKPTLYYDLEVNLAHIDLPLMNELEKLEPFGQLNMEPVFISNNVVLSDFKIMGSGNKHFSVVVSQGDVKLRGIAFNSPNLIEEYDDKVKAYNIAFFPVWNTFRGSKTLEIRIKDIKPA